STRVPLRRVGYMLRPCTRTTVRPRRRSASRTASVKSGLAAMRSLLAVPLSDALLVLGFPVAQMRQIGSSIVAPQDGLEIAGRWACRHRHRPRLAHPAPVSPAVPLKNERAAGRPMHGEQRAAQGIHAKQLPQKIA